MPGGKKRPLSELELQYLAEYLSDVSDIDEPFDDSDVDPWYAESSEYDSEESAENNQRSKKSKDQQQPKVPKNQVQPQQGTSSDDEDQDINLVCAQVQAATRIQPNVIWYDVDEENLNEFPTPQEDSTLGPIVETRHDDSPLSFYRCLVSDDCQ
ncbi:unnamed protein product [Acanthoscelides obtectus]|uniref:Ig-like domain-containing protein n=1 Tax=Acanthoscelides obtectus TaxID=200917 RepID=A0A9P0PDH7_ACAOB|nr:unnamed protein product [Acanthoscelides obtectus]CAK1641900.1 hypothetical protein AOBTE_LOCUS12707 [Acanthoscelides obtectus]